MHKVRTLVNVLPLSIHYQHPNFATTFRVPASFFYVGILDAPNDCFEKFIALASCFGHKLLGRFLKNLAISPELTVYLAACLVYVQRGMRDESSNNFLKRGKR